MKYIVLFREINVGGKHIVKMEGMRHFLSDLGLYNVTTYIQSGNQFLKRFLRKTPFSGLYGTSFRKAPGLKAV